MLGFVFGWNERKNGKEYKQQKRRSFWCLFSEKEMLADCAVSGFDWLNTQSY